MSHSPLLLLSLDSRHPVLSHSHVIETPTASIDVSPLPSPSIANLIFHAHALWSKSS
jgi:hypothetical protein